jgi:hypothetical protein
VAPIVIYLLEVTVLFFVESLMGRREEGERLMSVGCQGGTQARAYNAALQMGKVLRLDQERGGGHRESGILLKQNYLLKWYGGQTDWK